MQKKVKKIIPYFLILIILIGLFSPTGKIEAQSTDPADNGGTCYDSFNNPTNLSKYQCGLNNLPYNKHIWRDAGQPAPGPSQGRSPTGGGLAPGTPGTGGIPVTTGTPTGNALYDNLPVCVSLTKFDVGACLVNISYYLFYTLPAMLLTLAARLFDAILALTLSSQLYGPFISSAWVVVRDLANIFFILILLYIAIKVILGMAGHGVKQMIVQVVIAALLINFSMFFTKIVIDSSNILALIFYNKIGVVVKNSAGDTVNINYVPILNANKVVQDKDIAGALVSRFDPSRLLGQPFFDKVKKTTYEFSAVGFAAYVGGGALIGNLIPIPGVGAAVGAAAGGIGYFLSSGESAVPAPLMFGIIITAGLTMAFAAYTFFIAAFAFLSRIVELWVLIIASPFAFMSSTVPYLGGVEYIGWHSWTKKLLKTSFLAPIFLFFVYVIIKIIEADPIGSVANRSYEQQGWMESMLLLIIPALIILVLLNLATKYAKSSSGQLGEGIMSVAKVATGLAVGGAALGVASVGKGTLGKFIKGATTGETLANRVASERAARAINPAYRDPGLGRLSRLVGRGQLATRIPALQNRVGGWLNARQIHHEEAREARHDLDSVASAVAPGKKWDELNGAQRFLAREKLARDRAVRENSGNNPGPLGLALGTRKWDALTTIERNTINTAIGSDGHGHAVLGGPLETNTTFDDFGIINQARRRQGTLDTLTQAATTGSYDVRNLANVVARAQTSGFTMLTAGLVGAVAMSMRGGFKSMGVNYGESKGNFFQDLGNTVTDALKSAKINVDLSGLGEVKKKDDKGGGGHH